MTEVLHPLIVLGSVEYTFNRINVEGRFYCFSIRGDTFTEQKCLEMLNSHTIGVGFVLYGKFFK